MCYVQYLLLAFWRFTFSESTKRCVGITPKPVLCALWYECAFNYIFTLNSPDALDSFISIQYHFKNSALIRSNIVIIRHNTQQNAWRVCGKFTLETGWNLRKPLRGIRTAWQVRNTYSVYSFFFSQIICVIRIWSTKGYLYGIADCILNLFSLDI